MPPKKTTNMLGMDKERCDTQEVWIDSNSKYFFLDHSLFVTCVICYILDNLFKFSSVTCM